MLTADFPTIGVLDATLPATSDPLYQIASLSLTVHRIIKNLSDEGFQFKAVETTDINTYVTDMQTGVDNYINKYEDILQTGTSAVIANIPDVATILTALVSGGSDAILATLLQGVLDVVCRKFEERIDSANGEFDGGDLGNIETLLGEIRDKLDEIFIDEADDAAMVDIVRQAFIDPNPGGTPFALLWALARQAIRVQITSTGELDDVLLDDT